MDTNKTITNDKIYLKVKIRSLAEESKIIRYYEKDSATSSIHRYGLSTHRKDIVRKEARASLLAYGCINNKPYSKIEINAGPDKIPDSIWESVERLAIKYGTPITLEKVIKTKYFTRVKDWIQSAKNYLNERKKTNGMDYKKE